MQNCLFCKFASGDIKKDFIYEDNDVMVFADINPVKPVHHLIVPKSHISDFLEIKNENLLQKLVIVAQDMVKREGLDDKGFRIGINGGGAQVINHLHVHLIGPMKKTDGM